MQVSLAKEAIKPSEALIDDLDPGQAFELGGIYYVRTPCIPIGKVRSFSAVELRNFSSMRFPEGTTVKLCRATVVVEYEESE